MNYFSIIDPNVSKYLQLVKGDIEDYVAEQELYTPSDHFVYSNKEPNIIYVEKIITEVKIIIDVEMGIWDIEMGV